VSENNGRLVVKTFGKLAVSVAMAATVLCLGEATAMAATAGHAGTTAANATAQPGNTRCPTGVIGCSTL
jgi:hypothetical protein